MAFDFTCLATVKANSRSAISLAVGDRLVTTLRSAALLRAPSRSCARKPPARLLRARPSGDGSGSPPVSSSRRFFLAPSTASASFEKDGAMMTSENSLPISSAVLPSSGRLAAIMRGGDAARIGVLDDGDGRRFELRHQLERRVCVVEVVVAELLALQLPRG